MAQRDEDILTRLKASKQQPRAANRDEVIDAAMAEIRVLRKAVGEFAKGIEVSLEVAKRLGYYTGTLLAIAHGAGEPRRNARRALEKFHDYRDVTADGLGPKKNPRRRR